jgi:hypothetical protein
MGFRRSVRVFDRCNGVTTTSFQTPNAYPLDIMKLPTSMNSLIDVCSAVNVCEYFVKAENNSMPRLSSSARARELKSGQMDAPRQQGLDGWSSVLTIPRSM